MQVLPVYRGALLCFFWVSLLFSASFCHGSTVQKVEVVGIGECADCKQNNIKISQAFSGTVFLSDALHFLFSILEKAHEWLLFK